MDLRSMLNEGSGPAPAAPVSSRTQQQPPLAQRPMPSTPIQTAPPTSFRDYSQSTQASPGRPPSHEYAAQQTPFASPPPYHPQVGPYVSRPAPPPLQPLTSGDVRSPSASSMPGPSPSYRHTPTSSVSAVAGGYPFPPTQAAAGSPVQQHRYPPSGAYPPRESFSQASAPIGMTGPQGAPSYMQGTSPITPPVGTPGGVPQYLHQRSQSAQSTPTPTSAQSQQHYGPPYASPVATTHQLPPSEQMRQPSQPPTPLGPPRASAGVGSFAQPPSPYQQRMSASAFPYPAQSSPAPPAPPSIQRMSTSSSIYESQTHPADLHRRSTSRSERERSISVSPKTRIPSLPSSGGHPSVSGPASEPDPRQYPPNVALTMESVERDRAVAPAKRKMDDRDLRPEDIERQEPRPPPFSINGSHIPSHIASRASLSRSSTSPLIQRKKRVRYPHPPVWAQSQDGRPLNMANYVVRKAHQVGQAQVNGKSERAMTIKSERTTSRHQSPDASRSQPPVGAPVQAPQPPASAAAPARSLEPRADYLGPWEPSITGQKPIDEICRSVADWLFVTVVQNEELGSISDPDVKFEIEAKLGMLVSKDTNDRVRLPIMTECLLVDNGRVSFRSSMTEAQHKDFNDFLNAMVVEADPRNPKCAISPRVPIKYQHRREIDKFYELPPSMRDNLPPVVQNRLPPKHTVKVRVTTDQKTGRQLAKIVKVRIGDLNLYLPGGELDCRISVNLEVDWHGSVQELESLQKPTGIDGRLPDRNKDRLSYEQSHYQIDLTQVTQMVPGLGNTLRQEKEHELEIEVSADTLITQGYLARDGQPNNYSELVEGFIDNVRVLARKARSFA